MDKVHKSKYPENHDDVGPWQSHYFRLRFWLSMIGALLIEVLESLKKRKKKD